MKILTFCWRDIKHPDQGGSEVYLFSLFAKLIAKGHAVTVFTSSFAGALPYEEIDGVKIIRRGNRFTVYLWAAWYYFNHFRGQFDVIIDQHNAIPFFTPFYVSSTPIVCLVHHLFDRQFFYELGWPGNYLGFYLEKYAFPYLYRQQNFIAVSQFTADNLKKSFKLRDDQIKIINPGIDPDFKKSTRKSSTPSIVYIGRLKKYKRIEILIRSLLRLVYFFPDLKLHIVGDGDYRRELVSLVSRLGLDRFVIFHGYVQPALKQDLLSQAWLLVSPSGHEGWGISVIEAAACGTAAVGSRDSGLSCSIDDQVTGLLFEPGSIYDLSAKIKEIIGRPGLRYRLEKEAYDRSKQFYWSGSARLFDKYLRRVSGYKDEFLPLQSAQMPARLPLVSVLVPTKNAAQTLPACLKSINKQSYPNLELIVVDNHSSDGSYNLAKRYTDHVFSQGPNRNAQRNYAASIAKGRYLMFVDADMVLSKQLVADCVYRLERFGKTSSVIIPEVQIGKSIWSRARRLEKEFNMLSQDLESPRFFRRDAYQKSGGYDENLVYGEDFDLTTRVRRQGNITRCVHEIYHDEDNLSYWDILAKKYYYGSTAKYYFAKNPKKAAATTKYIRPVYLQNWPKFLDRPLTSVVFFFLRTTELSAMALGYLVSLVPARFNHGYGQTKQ